MASVALPAPGHVLCAVCGTDTTTGSGLCASCLGKEVSFSGIGVPLSDMIMCSECNGWLPFKKAASSSSAERTTVWPILGDESPELLALCLKQIAGIGKGKTAATFRDARFVWTEPHSRRIRLKVLVEKDVPDYNTAVQKEIDVELKVRHRMCPACARSTAGMDWQAKVQLRQRVAHKRTFLAFEQRLIRDGGASRNWIRIDDSPPDGMDFYFDGQSEARHFAKYVAAHVPVGNRKESKSLVSHDARNATANETFSIFLEILPICKHDLVLLPPGLHSKLFGSSTPAPVVCSRIASTAHLVDVVSGRSAQLVSDKKLWKSGAVGEIAVLATASTSSEEFVVMDAIASGNALELTLARADEVGEVDAEMWQTYALSALIAVDGSWKKGAEAGHSVYGYRHADAVFPVRVVRTS